MPFKAFGVCQRPQERISNMTEKEVLDKLSEIENAAQTAITRNAEKKAALQKQSDERTAEYDRQIDEESRKELEGVRASLEKSLQEQLTKLDEDTKKEKEFMDSHYTKELDRRADEIVARILK